MRSGERSLRLAGLGTTIFQEMSALATATGSINLGQGFPDTDGPVEVADAAVQAIRSGRNQYAPGPGVPELRAAVAEHQRRWYGLSHDPDTEVAVTTGATEAIAGMSGISKDCDPGASSSTALVFGLNNPEMPAPINGSK